MTNQFQVKDSGERRDFDTGAKRDVDCDKPRYDLIPMTSLSRVISYYSRKEDISNLCIEDVKALMWDFGLLWGNSCDDGLLLSIIWIALDLIQKQEKDNLIQVKSVHYSNFHVISPKTYTRLAYHYSHGAKKYDPWNWAKGMPLSTFHASLMRHIYAFISDEPDEDHLSAIFFNAASILHFKQINRHDVDDISPRLEEWASYASN